MLDATRQPVPTARLIAAATPGTGELLTIFAWFVIVALAAVGGIYLVMVVRRWTQREQRTATFTIQDLRDMRARGDISEPEFVAMRATILTQLDVPRPTASSPPPGGDEDRTSEDGPASPS
jgi:uncharacterized membrane protein